MHTTSVQLFELIGLHVGIYWFVSVFFPSAFGLVEVTCCSSFVKTVAACRGVACPGGFALVEEEQQQKTGSGSQPANR